MVSFRYLCFTLILHISCVCTISEANQFPMTVHNLEPGKKFRLQQTQNEYPEIFCYPGRPKHIIRIWETVQLQLSLTNDDFIQFDGVTPQEVKTKFEEHRSSWHLNLFSWRDKNIRLNPFNQTCIGILTDHDYSIHLKHIRIDYWKVLFLVFGLVLFVFAPKLCNNSLFYYLTGISVGVCASFLILVLVLGRFLPKKPIMYSFIIGGWTVGVYIVQLLWDNIRTVAQEYRSYVLMYIAVTGILSFVICYRFGPVTDQRSRNLVMWALQGVSLVLIFCSSEFQEASLAIILIFLIFYNIPLSISSNIFYKVTNIWYKPKYKLLSEDEYHHQGVEETRKALEELRGYCSSPECNQWKTVLKIKHPLRFAKFMEGASHLEDEEVLAFEMDTKHSISGELMTDDSDND